ncbi:hypothetical protein G5V65_00495 [Rhodobacter sp. HX-7-19]|uniref:Uncharacterized protein n=1 Tax=Paragemmobacter kunshanensis TaxID=2583234 RepID=A0A6M1TQP4_9RHOB|nr:DUF6173 family protein [Rhodobacter kunshanensis]NGQ89356.1 hypothetical protein [Rhodobacter kunshanensis]
MKKDEISTTAEFAEAAALTAAAEPRAKAVHADPAQCGTLESAPLPKAATRRSVEEKSPAEWAYERLILYIQNFEAQLDASEEVAMGFTGGQAGVLSIEGVGFFDPDLVTFYGRDEDGLRTQLIQHVTQLNVILRAVPRETPAEPPRRIGFQMMQQWAGGDSGDASA